MKKTLLFIMSLAGPGLACTNSSAQETMTNQWMVSISENYSFCDWGTTLSSGWYDFVGYHEFFASLLETESPTSVKIPLKSLDVMAGYTLSPRLAALPDRTMSVYFPVSAYIGYEWVNYRGTVSSSQLSASHISKERLLWGISIGLKAERYLCNHIAVTVESALGYDFGSQVKQLRPSLSAGLRKSL